MEFITHRPPPPPHNLPFIEEPFEAIPRWRSWRSRCSYRWRKKSVSGLLFGAVRKRWGSRSTILITAIIFGASHGDLFYFVPLAAIGLVLAGRGTKPDRSGFPHSFTSSTTPWLSPSASVASACIGGPSTMAGSWRGPGKDATKRVPPLTPPIQMRDV